MQKIKRTRVELFRLGIQHNESFVGFDTNFDARIFRFLKMGFREKKSRKVLGYTCF